ncbi:S-layer homology domain-containing protein [Collinsella tanakaei]|uniref:S-layer homology domain-containing protein n=1 Tax=Collinsella tanakaei TaxID=626935 RepID=UPI00195B3B13|nr:S-layer homology domain-containing protein [Collinsella tanakaei]MBM6778761.1 S-layer homology domain-containing protein [Collinsella tanakaei]
MTSLRRHAAIFSTAAAFAIALGSACALPAWASNFIDVSGHWAETSGIIDRAVAAGIVGGSQNADGTFSFRPDHHVTRAEAAQMLMNVADGSAETWTNETPFVDVADGVWYVEAINWAYEAGIMNGSNGRVRPEDVLTREELAVMLTNYLSNVLSLQATGDDSLLAAYPDNILISSWARPAMAWAVASEIMGGNTVLSPGAPATRAEAAKMLVVFNDMVGDGASDGGSNGGSNGGNSSNDGVVGGIGSAAVEIALRYEGYPYKYGGASPETGFDCSGLVMYVYSQLGISLPHSAGEQMKVLQQSGGRFVTNVADLQYGDLVFFEGHVAFYVGNGQVFGARREGVPASVGQLEWFAPFLGGGQF